MSGRVSGSASARWAGSIVLIAVGMALGYTVYPWIGSDSCTAGTEESDSHGDERHEPAGSRLLHIAVDDQRAGGLSVRRAELRQFESLLHVTGTVSADQTRVARIRPLARGVVDRVFVQLGDRVNKGDPLLSYDNIDLGLAVGEFLAAHADLRSTRTTLEVSETILARSREMLEFEAVARTEHDVLEAEFRSAKAEVDRALALVAKFEEQLHRFGLSEAELDRLSGGADPDYHRTVSRATLQTPSSGVVSAYDVGPGEVIDPSSALLTVTDMSVVWVLADVSEKDLSAVRVDKPVSIQVSSYPGEPFEGRITHAGDIVAPESRTTQVRCVVRNPRARLKIGMFATIDIPTGSVYEAVAVPSEAIRQVGGGPVVFVQRSDDEFEIRPVETGAESDGWLEVASGIGPGDAVIADGTAIARNAELGEGHAASH